MVEIELDGKKVEVAAGSMVMHAAEKAGTYIPHFCYHKKLTIAANCRMCLVDIEKIPKAAPACATPVTQGMIVRTKSKKAVDAQKSVMEFLLINHPLDCPICDQGGECQLQDLAVGYGGSSSRYAEEKRVVFHKDVGPLISMQEMSRCIHCTRCVRFGKEIAGVMELGLSHRGEHAEIESFVGMSVDSELSGNMIDICPVGALTSKPFRYQARTWELSRRKSVSPHDSTGSNLIVQVKNNQVMRVVPMENEAVNECWIADRDRFSYESLNSPDRLQVPMIKQAGDWHEVDWQTALTFIADAFKDISQRHGADRLGALMSPQSTLEELYLGSRLMRALGCENVDSRLRAADFAHDGLVRWLGCAIEDINHMRTMLFMGGNLRKEHPILAQRVRYAILHGAQIFSLNETEPDWAMKVSQNVVRDSEHWVQALVALCSSVAKLKGVQPVVPFEGVDAEMDLLAQSLVQGERMHVFLGNAFAHHPKANTLLSLVNWLTAQVGCTFGFLGESANTVGAQWVQARPMPNTKGLNVSQMLEPGALKGVLLMNLEPEHDCAHPQRAIQALSEMDLVVTLSPFKANLEFSDVILPIAPFSETPGTFVNTQGLEQSFHAVVRPLGGTRPAWKVMRVLANMLGLDGFEYETIEEVRASLHENLPPLADRLSNQCHADLDFTSCEGQKPCTAPSYQLDGLVRRSPALQATTDARLGR